MKTGDANKFSPVTPQEVVDDLTRVGDLVLNLCYAYEEKSLDRVAPGELEDGLKTIWALRELFIG